MSSAAALAVTDVAKDDIQVLLAGSYGPSVSVSGAQSSNTFDLTECDPVTANSYYHTYDCTTQLEEMTGRPAMERVLVGANVQQGGYIVSSYYCRVMTVRTVLLAEAARSPVFTGIGFWASQGGGIRFVPKTALKEVGRSNLKDGREVLVHEFVGTALCWQGSASSSMRAQYRFKPFAAYDTGIESFHVWENVANDHAISSSFAAWDRTADLLQ
jgi:hypothetical protein